MNNKDCQYWWDAPSAVKHERIFAHIDDVRKRQGWIYEIFEENEKMYSGRVPDTKSGRYQIQINNKLYVITDNLVASAVDSVCAFLGVQRPTVKFQPNNGEWHTYLAGKNYDKFITGIFKKLKVYPKIFRTLLEANLSQGTLKIDKRDGEPFCDVIKARDLTIDQIEARDGQFRQIHQRTLMDREYLKQLFPDKEKEIDLAPAAQSNPDTSSSHSTQVEVSESWHLRSPCGWTDEDEGKVRQYKDDGQYCVVLRNCTLQESPYEKDYFPFLFMDFSEPLEGTYGQSPVERVTPLQIKYDKQNRFIWTAQHRMIRPIIIVDEEVEYDDQLVDPEIATILKAPGGRAPTAWSPGALPPEPYQERDRLATQIFARFGMNELYTAGKKEANTTSGIAINAATDIMTGRFGPISQKLEDMVLDIAQRLIWVAKDLHEEGHDIQVTSINHRKSSAETIKWSDLTEDEELYCMEIEAESALARSQSGRLAEANELTQGGAITPDVWMRMVDDPDIDQLMDEENGDYYDILYTVEALEREQYNPPSSLQNLKLAIPLIRKRHNKIRHLGAPDSTLGLFRRWISNAVEILKQSVAPPGGTPPGGAPPGAVPPGVPPSPGVPPQ